MMIEREYYPLHALAERWEISVSDLVHLGIQHAVQICVNIYGMARGIHRIRQESEGDTPPDFEPVTEDEKREAAEINAAVKAWENRTTQNMPDGIFELDSDTLRFIDMPEGQPFNMFEAMKFDGGWWNVDFDPPVAIRYEHLCMLHDEVVRLGGDKFHMPDARQAAAEDVTPWAVNRGANMSKKLAILNQAASTFWANADRDDPTTQPNKAEIIRWLTIKGFAPSLARQGSTIIRPEWAWTGRKPEK